MTATTPPDDLTPGGAQAPPSTFADLVVLLDENDAPSGTADRLTVHSAHTPLHLAFSLHLVDEQGRTLLTRRALSKKTWPGVWTNTCCGHPRPGEDVAEAAVRRTGEELGIDLTSVDVHLALPDFRYRAVDASGIVEHEVCPVHVAFVDSSLALDPDPAEVAEKMWVDWANLHGAVLRTPFAFSPWMVLQVTALGPDITSRHWEGPTR
jgi:isopentenyl-diphosphate Delta-isomerase